MDSGLHKHPSVCQFRLVSTIRRTIEASNRNFNSNCKFQATYGLKFANLDQMDKIWATTSSHFYQIQHQDGQRPKWTQTRPKPLKVAKIGATTTYLQSPGLNFKSHHQLVKNPMILCNTPLWFVVEYKLEVSAAKWSQLRAAVEWWALPENWYAWKESLFPVFLSVRLPRAWSSEYR